MTAPPATVRIGPLKYRVRYVDHIDGDEGETVTADKDPLKCKIRILSSLCKQEKRVALWHEVLHIILDINGVEVKHEEALIQMLSHRLMEVLQDNPELRE